MRESARGLAEAPPHRISPPTASILPGPQPPCRPGRVHIEAENRVDEPKARSGASGRGATAAGHRSPVDRYRRVDGGDRRSSGQGKGLPKPVSVPEEAATGPAGGIGTGEEENSPEGRYERRERDEQRRR